MKKMFIFCLLMLIACKEKEKFLEPQYILNKWAKATQTLNYHDYQGCEAFPKSPDVFREMYGEYYLTDIAVGKIEDFDKKKIEKDIDGNSHYSRNVTFECMEVNRKTQKPVKLIRGYVVLIKYLPGTKKNENWLMSNRTLIRIEK